MGRDTAIVKFIKQHPLFSGVLLLQFLFIAVQAAAFLHTPAALCLTESDFSDVDGSLRCSVTLPAGGYEITADYDTDAVPPAGQTAAELTVFSPDAALWSDTVFLTDTYRTITARFWIPAARQGCTVRLTVTPAEGQGIALHTVTLQPRPVWQLTVLLARLLLFAACDALLWLFLTKSPRLRSVCRPETALLSVGIVLASLPYFSDFLYTGHDLNFHLYRILNLAQSMADGQFPVRLFTSGFNGYGAATPQFYCDLFLYIPALLYNLFLPLQFCFRVYVVLVNTGTALAAYYAFARIGGCRRSAAVAAFCYTLSAYRLTNVMIRAAVGEYTAMAFLPLVVLGAWAITAEERPALRDWLPLAVGMAGLLQSHLLTAEMTTLLLVLYWLVRVRVLFTKARLTAAVKAACTAFGLSAWFLIPCLDALQNEYVMVSGIHPSPLQSTGLGILQLLGLAADPKTGMTLTVGPTGLLALLLAAVCCLCRLPDSPPRGRKTLRTVLPFALLTLWLSTRYFPWDFLQTMLPQKITDLLYKFQFCWRWLSPAAVLSGVLTAGSLALLARHRRLQTAAAACFVAATLVFSAAFGWSYNRTQGRITYISTDTATAFPVLTMGYDYLPAGTDLDIFSAVQATTEDSSVTVEWQGNGLLVCTNPANQPADVDLPLLAYRHYTARAQDGTLLPLASNEAHCLRVTVPAGYSGTVTVRFAEPPLWRLAECITLFTVLLPAALFVLARVQHTARRKAALVS